MTEAIRRRDITTVRNGVTALDRFPGGMLRGAKFLFLGWMPADGCRIKNNFRAAQRGQPRRLGIPLVPANAHADLSLGRFPCLKSQIARRKIKFLMIQRIVRDMHFAIFAEQLSVRVDDDRGVVINAGAAFLEQ